MKGLLLFDVSCIFISVDAQGRVTGQGVGRIGAAGHRDALHALACLGEVELHQAALDGESEAAA